MQVEFGTVIILLAYLPVLLQYDTCELGQTSFYTRISYTRHGADCSSAGKDFWIINLQETCCFIWYYGFLKAAFYFLRSAAPHYRRFAPLRCAKVAAGWRVRGRACMYCPLAGKRPVTRNMNSLKRKKPAAFCFLRSLALTTDVLLRFAAQKSRRVGESLNVSAWAALQRESNE